MTTTNQLLVSLKDVVARKLNSPDLSNAFRQVETWVNHNVVNSVFGRRGVVIAQSGDYTAAQVTNALVNIGTGVQFQRGTTAVNAVANVATISFPVAFASTPIVVACIGDTNNTGGTCSIGVGSVSTTGFQCACYMQSGTSYVGVGGNIVRVNWIAVG